VRCLSGRGGVSGNGSIYVARQNNARMNPSMGDLAVGPVKMHTQLEKVGHQILRWGYLPPEKEADPTPFPK